MKGKPWPTEDEQRLRKLFESGSKDYGLLSKTFQGKYSENAIYQKLLDLGLVSKEEEARKKRTSSSTLTLKRPAELPSVEDVLKTLAAALKSLETPGLEKSDVLRLRGIIAGCKIYKELLADYMDYRGLEAELLELREKYEGLAKKTESSSPR
jgi:hypothetical protein